MRTTRNAEPTPDRAWTLALPLPVGGDLSLDLFLTFSNMLETAVFALDAHAVLTGLNRGAMAMLGDADGLRNTDGRLTAAALDDSRKLSSAIELAAAEPSAHHAVPTTRILAVRRCGRAALTTAVVPAWAVLRGGSGRASVLLFASDPEVNIDHSIDLVCQLYGLTPTEAQVSRYLVQGFSTGDIALAMDLKEETIRAYLKHIYAKTQVHGQASLVQLLMSSRPALQLEACRQEIIIDNPRGR